MPEEKLDVNSVRRLCRTMEATGGEVRRLQVIYFLSRMGRIEHPHLIRVHHASRNGVHLRDVKRWLSELRGKGMPESFAWSYKRRYKTGYVWQDLLDDDLITPISDNEYVLKGSQISVSLCDSCSCGQKTDPLPKNRPLESFEAEDKLQQPSLEQEAILGRRDCNINMSTCKMGEDQSPPFGSETSMLTDNAMKLGEDKSVEISRQLHEQCGEFEMSSSSCYSNPSNKKNKKNKKNNVEKASASSSSFSQSKSYSSGASQVFRNLITCGGVVTNDSAMVTIRRTTDDRKTSENSAGKPFRKADVCGGEKLGRSARIFGTYWSQQQQHGARKRSDGVKGSKTKSEFAIQQQVSAALVPVSGPNCSQCGKSFRPEKLLAHMKSCRGMKILAKNAAAAAEKIPLQGSMNSSNEESAPGYFLTR